MLRTLDVVDRDAPRRGFPARAGPATNCSHRPPIVWTENARSLFAAGLPARRLFLCVPGGKSVEMAIELTQAQKKHLRGLGQALNPTLQIGREGVTEANLAALDPLLKRHELVKVKVQQTSETTPQEAAQALAHGSNAAVIGIVGRTFLLYRPNPERKDGIRLK